jgi:hypothetical protein
MYEYTSIEKKLRLHTTTTLLHSELNTVIHTHYYIYTLLHSELNTVIHTHYYYTTTLRVKHSDTHPPITIPQLSSPYIHKYSYLL